MSRLPDVRKQVDLLRKTAERYKKDKAFHRYYRCFQEYDRLYKEVSGKLRGDEEIAQLKLKIPKLSEKELQELEQGGKYDATLGPYLSDVSDFSKRLLSRVKIAIKLEENIKEAKALLTDAKNAKKRASNLIENGDWNGSIEASQHCIEQSIKSLYCAFGERFPKEHDPTENLDILVKKFRNSKYDPHFSDVPKRIAQIRWIARVWAEVHTQSMYAFLEIPAKDFFEKKDAKILLLWGEGPLNLRWTS